MSSEKVIEFINVSKRYQIGPLSSIVRFLNRRKHSDNFWALNNISFNIERGNVFGIIGANGAGKSTILKLLAGVTAPDSGKIKINGRIAPLLELGAGFHPELTGRENVYLNGVLLGLTRKQITERFQTIIDFAELWDFIDVPVKKYSSGMFIRLGFAIAVHTDPDILLIDEVLSVGDERFQRKCLEKFQEFRRLGKTAIIVSHDLSLISNVCDRLMLLDHGKIIEQGAIDKTMGHYLTMVAGDIEGSAILTLGDMVTIFSNGKISIYYQGVEITKKWGVYTSVLIGKTANSPHLWIDSTRALWKCSEVSKNNIVCIGEFFNVPMKMEWKIKLMDNNALSIAVSLMLSENYHFERREANIMLSEKYTHWGTGENRGEFPQDFVSRDIYNWDILATTESRELSAMSDNLVPAVRFEVHTDECTAVVVNSNFFFRGRVLRYLNLNEEELSPGSYDYFRGEIRILTP